MADETANAIYSATVFYFDKPYNARVLTFLCYGADRKKALENAKQYAQDFADENEIPGTRLQLHLFKESVPALREVLDNVEKGDFRGVIIEKPRIFNTRQKIPLQIGDKVYNI